MQNNFDVHKWKLDTLLNESGADAAQIVIDKIRSLSKKLSDEDMDKFIIDIASFIDCKPPSYRLNESEDYLEKLADNLSKKHSNLRFIVSLGKRIDVRGSQQDMMDWGNENHGKKYGEYEVFHTDDDERGEIVRIVKSDSIYKGK